MPADPARLELAERRDALVDRLTGQLETLEEELEQARGVREEAEAARAALADAQNEIERLTARLTAARAELESTLAARSKDADAMMQLKAALSAAEGNEPSPSDGTELDRVLRAREREGSETELIGIAVRAFNRSPHAERVRETASRQGRPKVTLGVVGVALPRRVLVALTFGDEPRAFVVSLDLVARTASVARATADEQTPLTARPGRWSPEGGIELVD
jgi:septal ring factor EnvC (AmiA/AmiB activator)